MTKHPLKKLFENKFGTVAEINNTDGLRITFESEEIVHLRPSGNAPEFRCYVEANTSRRATEMKNICLKMMESWRE